jgi:hypothetical protein
VVVFRLLNPRSAQKDGNDGILLTASWMYIPINLALMDCLQSESVSFLVYCFGKPHEQLHTTFVVPSVPDVASTKLTLAGTDTTG